MTNGTAHDRLALMLGRNIIRIETLTDELNTSKNTITSLTDELKVAKDKIDALTNDTQ